MEIPNVTAFCRFVSDSGLAQKDSRLQQVIYCLNNYSAACNCYKREDKLNQYTQCNRLYREAVAHAVQKMKAEFLSKTQERQISFKVDGRELIGIISR